jgi:hypothetical protein
MTHAELVSVAENWLRGSRGCHIVLTERGAHEIPDAIGWGDETVVVEVKISKADFLADLKKPHRNRPESLGRERWYLVPKGLLTFEAIPRPWGLLEWTGRACMKTIKPERLAECAESLEHERRILLGELRAFHAQGITYKRGSERWTPTPSSQLDPERSR